MHRIAAAIEQRFPKVFVGPGAKIARPLLKTLARINHFDRLQDLLNRHQHLRGLSLVDALLADLDCRYLIDQIERERIPETGACLIVANHPLGALDALALLSCVGKVRRDLRIIANDLLSQIDGLGNLLLPVRVIGGQASLVSLAAIDRALAAGMAVIVFPAGEVARLGHRGVADASWHRGFLRFAQRAQAALLPVHLGGHNSALFYGLSALYKPLGTALLAREIFSRKPRRMVIRVGTAVAADRLATDPSTRPVAAEQMRRAVQALGRGQDLLPKRPAALAHSARLRDLIAELRELQPLGATPDGKQILCGKLSADSALMHEIARLREFTFRSVGEGTGRLLDRDAYDNHYQQLLLWDPQQLEIAGAYRIADGRQVVAEHGTGGLYCTSLFEFTPDLVAKLDSALELGRSFVQPKYWGSRSLDYLWLGIGAWLRQHRHINCLFGAVSISATLAAPAREWLVAYYRRYYGASQALAQAKNPFRFADTSPDFGVLDRQSAMLLLRDNLQALGAKVPTLYKQYTELCEPGGVHFIDFGVDPDFSGSVDGLVWLDLDQVVLRKRQRYLDLPSEPVGGITASARAA